MNLQASPDDARGSFARIIGQWGKLINSDTLNKLEFGWLDAVADPSQLQNSSQFPPLEDIAVLRSLLTKVGGQTDGNFPTKLSITTMEDLDGTWETVQRSGPRLPGEKPGLLMDEIRTVPSVDDIVVDSKAIQSSKAAQRNA